MVRAAALLASAPLALAGVPRPAKPAPIDIEVEFPKIPKEYIVVFHKQAADAEIRAHLSDLQGTDADMKFTYNGTRGFRGYAMRVSDEHGPAMKYVKQKTAGTYAAGAEVHYVEQNAVAKAFGPKPAKKSGCVTQTQATWGLVRVAQKELNIDGLYSYLSVPDADHDAKAYVLDTGIYRDNVEFEGSDGVRALFGADFTTSQAPKTDLNGHGTHCAGTIAGNLHGMVKDGTVVDVRVLGDDGSGSFAGIIAGIDFVPQDCAGGRCIASMSLGGGKSQAVNDAVDAASDEGVTFVVAAGNSAMDSCLFSPASAESAITVMCSDQSDEMCYFSNYGACSDIIAPGFSITSAWIGSPYSENTISGTSMSAPHVAGAALRLVASTEYQMTPDEVKAELLAESTKGAITQIMGGSSTPNRLLHELCAGSTVNVTKEPIAV
jgi:subtilisin family serine protease